MASPRAPPRGGGASRARAGACASRPGRGPPPHRGVPQPRPPPCPSEHLRQPRFAEPRGRLPSGCGCAVSPLASRVRSQPPQPPGCPHPWPDPALRVRLSAQGPGEVLRARAGLHFRQLLDPVLRPCWWVGFSAAPSPLARPVAGAGRNQPYQMTAC